jgi:nucleotide-binding universal stress UspA family protein
MTMDAERDQPARLETLEEEFAQLKAQNMTIMTQQAQILQKLGGTVPALTSPTVTPISGASDSKLKPAPPNEFDGSRSKGRAFLTSCDLYVSLVPHQFANDEKAVLWAISYMKTGRAALFAQRVIRHQVKYGLPKFATWDEFRDAFIAEFCPKNETGLAIAKLETEKYYQGKRSVDEYVDEFRELVEQAGYTQGLAIVVKFRRGLDKEIQDVIANIPIGRPADDNAEAWYKAAVQADENRTANDLFHSGPKTSRTPKTVGNVFSRTNPTSWPTHSTTFTPPKAPTPQNPTPMDIDATRKKHDTPDTCRRCGKVGHWAKDCERRFDIRYMLAEEREEWLQNLALEADKEEIEKREEVESESVSGF